MEEETTGEVVDKPIEDRERKILRSVRAGLVEDMDAGEVLLQMPNVFTSNEEEKIKSPDNTRRVQCETFLEILPSRGAKAYDIFKGALKKVNPSLVEVLNREGKLLHALCNNLISNFSVQQIIRIMTLTVTVF